MPLTDWKLKACTKTSQTVFIRSDSNGTATVTASNGQTASVTLDTSVHDGIGVCTVTGITDGMAFTITDTDGSQYDVGNFNLKPNAGDRFSIAGFSCMASNIEKDLHPLRQLAQEPRLKKVCDQGDTPYCQSTRTVWGVFAAGTETDLATAQLKSNYDKHHLQALRFPSIKALGHIVDYHDAIDDHEGATNNWDNSVSGANSDQTNIVFTTQAEIDGCSLAVNASYQSYAMGNNGWDNPIMQAPPQSNLLDSQVPVQYSSEIIGDALVVHFDCIASRGEAALKDETMLNTLQLAQIQTDCNSFNGAWIIVNSSKAFLQDNNGNLDGFTESAITEETSLMAYFTSLPQGVIMMTGDDHLVIHSENSGVSEFTCLTVAAISTDIKTGRVANANNKFIKMDFNNCYWVLDVQGAKQIDAYGVNIFGDRLHFGTLLPASKTLVKL